ncbi:hypothetical protein ICMP_327 [Candidatus Ishikawaella capsulata Mpkobe]|uniref:Uncharacterized protein n=1 Tax=Candidatus Ishikawaella capsulata Mpkobe TaxID=476281 RepID=C5WCX5_9ENTR|nr:hypothetical protein ICMP_327 [Candidatus Ishikawaella capsulata Mpkobe]
MSLLLRQYSEYFTLLPLLSQYIKNIIMCFLPHMNIE